MVLPRCNMNITLLYGEFVPNSIAHMHLLSRALKVSLGRPSGVLRRARRQYCADS